MSTDRELLELAAKAAGMNVSWDHYDPDYCAGAEGMFLNGERSPDNSKYWNPLTDDGDALRLAVKLRMNINIYSQGAEADCDTLESTCKEGGDPYAATRRAIVRAAAEIGRSMK